MSAPAGPDGLRLAREHLREVVPTTPRLWCGVLPGLSGVLVTHIEDGWVDLNFHGYTLRDAHLVADALLHPDALPTDDFLLRLTDEDGLHFQGFGWDDEPPAGVLARRVPTGPLPSLRAVRLP